jgi:hypothetical protein
MNRASSPRASNESHRKTEWRKRISRTCSRRTESEMQTATVQGAGKRRAVIPVAAAAAQWTPRNKLICALVLRRRKAGGAAKGNSGRDSPQHDARPACPVLRSSASLSCRSAASRTGVPSSSVTRSPGLSPARSAANCGSTWRTTAPGGRTLLGHAALGVERGIAHQKLGRPGRVRRRPRRLDDGGRET